MIFFRRFYLKLSLIFLALLALLALLQIVNGERIFRRRQIELEQRVNRNLAADMAAELEPHLDGDPTTDEIGSLIHYMMVLNPAIEIYVLDRSGNVLAFFAEPGKEMVQEQVDLEPLLSFLGPATSLPILGDDPRHPGDRTHFSAAPLRLGDQRRGYLYVVLESTQYDHASEDLGYRFLFDAITATLLVSLPLVAIVGLLIFFLLTRRLESLTRTVRAFASGDLLARAPARSRDELGELANSFNEMAGTILKSMEGLKEGDRLRRELVASISHDLRNPLASIQGYTETLLEKGDRLSPGERRRYLGVTLNRTKLLGRLVENLFELSKLEAREREPRRERFSLSELVQDVVSQGRLKSGEARVSVDAEDPGQLFLIEADVEMIERVLANLLDNAIAHSPAGGRVRIELREVSLGCDDRETPAVRTVVADEGPGVAPEERERVFQRFYISDQSRAAARRGSGLGLAISKHIVELHGGCVGIEESGERGSRFYFDLPLPSTSQ